MNGKAIGIIGAVATVVSVGASLLNNWVSDKKLDNKISKEVAKAIAEKKE